MVVEDAVERSSFFSEEPVELVVGQTREIQLLVGEEIHGLCQHPVIDRLKIRRTLGDNHNVGTVLPTLRLAEPSRRQQLIVEDKAMVIDEQDIDARFDIAVLVGVVEEHDIGVASSLVGSEAIDTLAALLVHRDMDLRKLALHLVRLVSYQPHRRIVLCQQIAPALALIAPAEHRHLCLVLQQADEILHMRRFARSAHGDIAHRDDGHTETPASENAQFEELVAKAHAQPVEPAQGAQPVVYFDEIAFHNTFGD